MRVLLSSKALAGFLFLIDWDKDTIQSAQLHSGTHKRLSLVSNNITLELIVESEEVMLAHTHTPINQRDRQWKHIYELVKAVPDQPVVLNIGTKTTSLTFQF